MAPAKNPYLSSPLSLIFLFFFSLNTHYSFAANSISTNQSLSGNQTIISEGGNFVLGFFSPGKSSQNYYIGIWYKRVSKVTPVWVANRETPLSDPTSSELRISSDGTLVLLNQFKIQIWSTNVRFITSNSTVAVILDSGNLVLRDGSNINKVFWQSFDHPTDTWLPGAQLGLNRVTGENQHLTSWKNSEDPAPGNFSLEINPNGTSQYLIQWNNSKTYWNSGIWNGKFFNVVPEMTENHVYDFKYVTDANGNYFTYSVTDSSIIARFIIDISGQFKKFTWEESAQEWIQFCSLPRKQCDVYALCGPFGTCNEESLPFCNCVRGFSEASPRDWDLVDITKGCVRNTPLQCGSNSLINGEKDKFFMMPNMRLPENPQSLVVGSTEDCEFACLNNCSCTAYSYSSECFLWYGDLLNLQQRSDGASGGTLYLRLAASDLPNSKSKKGLVTGAIVGGIGGFVAILALVLVLIWRHKRRNTFSTSKVVDGSLVPFRYSDLQYVTKNFSEKLGGGGFGFVFKGSLPDSTAIAVKKLKGLSQGDKQFRTEVSTIGIIQHVNLVRLLGSCSEGSERLLVYEFMPKGSLDTQLFQNKFMVLDWKTRYQIALGIARGLAYLHEKCRDCIIHCDIKPENVLLDAEFVPKVADFGLAKLLGRDFSRVLTTMRGTVGYLAPEWISGVAITAKADVYSYGMMLFEIISGRRNSDQTLAGQARFFPTLAVSKLMEGGVLSLVDQSLEGDANLEELNKACRVACWCIQDSEDYRPSMEQVVQILDGVLEVNMPPIPRSLQLLMEHPETDFF